MTMRTAKSIIVGVDYSTWSTNAVREAVRIAHRNNARLICLHAVDHELFDAFRDSEGFNEGEIRAIAIRRLEEHVAEIVASGHDIECHLAFGHPFEAMLEAIETHGAELVVIGSQGLDAEDPNRIGAFAARCVRKAPADVLLVRERQVEPFRSVVACVDFSETSIRAAYQAAEIADQDKSGLELLHVYQTPTFTAPDVGIFAPALPVTRSPEIARALEDKLDRLADEISDAVGGIEIHTHVEEFANIATGIAGRIEELGADLAVLGTRGRTGLKCLLLGTTAEKVIHQSPCSTLAVKPEGFGKR